MKIRDRGSTPQMALFVTGRDTPWPKNVVAGPLTPFLSATRAQIDDAAPFSSPLTNRFVLAFASCHFWTAARSWSRCAEVIVGKAEDAVNRALRHSHALTVSPSARLWKKTRPRPRTSPKEPRSAAEKIRELRNLGAPSLCGSRFRKSHEANQKVVARRR